MDMLERERMNGRERGERGEGIWKGEDKSSGGGGTGWSDVEGTLEYEIFEASSRLELEGRIWRIVSLSHNLTLECFFNPQVSLGI